jgi:hypothetical protein
LSSTSSTSCESRIEQLFLNGVVGISRNEVLPSFLPVRQIKNKCHIKEADTLEINHHCSSAADYSSHHTKSGFGLIFD